MKRIAVLAGVLSLAACQKSKDNPAPTHVQGGGASSTAAQGGKKPDQGSTASSTEPGVSRSRGPDPVGGNYTLAEATDGLAGNGKLGAEIETDQGTIHCELFPDVAPQTVASFVGLARGVRPWKDPDTGEWVTGKPFFDGLAFHRVIPEFMIQGGDPLSRHADDPNVGTGGPGFALPDEVSPKLKFDHPGVMAMANAGPGTDGSQFFVTEVPYESLNGGYTIFGQCQDVDVVKKIARVPVDSPDHNMPTTPVRMKVRIVRK